MRKRKITLIMSIICITIFFLNIGVLASEMENIKLDTDISNWVYHDDSDTIYAINKQTCEFIVIDANDLKLIDRKKLKEKPIDINLYENKIYIIFENTKKIVVIDTKNKDVIKEIDVKVKPVKIQIANKKIFYIKNTEGFKKVYVYDMDNNTNIKLEKSFHNPDIKVDRSKNILYIAESDNSESKLYVMDISSYEILKNTESILYPDKGVYTSGDYIIYNKKSSTLNDLNNREGYFKGNAIYALNGFLFTDMFIFDIETNKKISTLAKGTKLVLMDDKENIYFYNNETKKIYKYNSIYDIDPKLNETLKIDINNQGNWIFTWDEITNTKGYNLWYKVKTESFDNDKLIRLNEEVINENKFKLKKLPDEIKNKTIYIAVTPEADNIDFDFVEKNMNKLLVNKFQKLNKYLKNNNLSELDTVDLDFVTTKIKNFNKDNKTGDIVLFDEMLFNTLLDNIGSKVESYELKCQLNNKLMMKLPGSSFLKLYEYNSKKKIIVKTEKLDIEIPMDKFDFLKNYSNIKESEISIEIQENINKDEGIIKPFKLDIRINKNNTSEKIKSIGTGYINLKTSFDGNLENAVGINLNNKTYVPIKYIDEKKLINLQINGSGTFSLIRSDKTFSDIKKHWARDDISLLKSKLILKGKNDNKFHPNENITRKEFIAILTRALGINSNDKHLTFKDINKSDWFYNSVNSGVSTGLIKGYSKDYFKPDEYITREEMAVIIYRSIEILDMENKYDKNNDFLDSKDINDWAKNEVNFILKSGLMKGYNNKFYPNKSATRAESVVVIKRLLENSNIFL